MTFVHIHSWIPLIQYISRHLCAKAHRRMEKERISVNWEPARERYLAAVRPTHDLKTELRLSIVMLCNIQERHLLAIKGKNTDHKLSGKHYTFNYADIYLSMKMNYSGLIRNTQSVEIIHLLSLHHFPGASCSIYDAFHLFMLDMICYITLLHKCCQWDGCSLIQEAFIY